jgi:hypothetical protein
MCLSAELPLAGSRPRYYLVGRSISDLLVFRLSFFDDRTSLFLLVYQWTDSKSRALQEYFGQTIGPVKRVDLSYALGGKSKGIATVVFTKPAAAARAAKELDGLKVDTKPMKASLLQPCHVSLINTKQIEVIVAAKEVPAPPAPKSLSDRVAKPKPAAKAQPKPATAAKATTGPKGERKPRGGRGRNAGRGKPKSADELDAEMQDYFVKPDGAGDAAMSNGGAVQPTNGDAGMEDDGEFESSYESSIQMLMSRSYRLSSIPNMKPHCRLVNINFDWITSHVHKIIWR